ncbi:hypothetical protein BKI52_29775 [marine bacterium AO1-C]|nr:hypothetical protein BKI52_29775 [marine bacterium AO1-C]
MSFIKTFIYIYQSSLPSTDIFFQVFFTFLKLFRNSLIINTKKNQSFGNKNGHRLTQCKEWQNKTSNPAGLLV